MTLDNLHQTQVFHWVLIPAFIFLARVCDVSVGTIRLLMIARGKKSLAPLLGFVEVMIWLLAFHQVIMNLTNVACYLAFAGGFATGNYVGMLLEERLAIGSEVIRIITKNDVEALMGYFRDHGHGITRVEGEGTTGKVHMLFSIFSRRDRNKIVENVRRLSPKAFYTIEDIRSVNEGVFPKRTGWISGSFLGPWFKK